jgi:hypothetical protein
VDWCEKLPKMGSLASPTSCPQPTAAAGEPARRNLNPTSPFPGLKPSPCVCHPSMTPSHRKRSSCSTTASLQPRGAAQRRQATKRRRKKTTSPPQGSSLTGKYSPRSACSKILRLLPREQAALMLARPHHCALRSDQSWYGLKR